MADSSVPITAGSGTPIRVLTALGAASADQQVVTLADSAGNLLGTSAAPVPVTEPDTVVTGNISAASAVSVTGAAGFTSTALAANSSVSINVSGVGVVSVMVSGNTPNNLLLFEGTFDGTNWTAVNGVTPGTGAQVSGNSSAKFAVRIAAAGMSAIRVRSEVTWTAVTVAVTLRCSIGSTVTTLSEPLPGGTATIGTVLLGAGSAAVGTVAMAAITKGTQGATGVTTQDLKDAGRGSVAYYMLIPVLTSATDTLQSLTGTKGGATVTATTTPAVVTSGKTFRIQRFWATYVATATSGYGIVRLRYNTGGVVAIGSPVLQDLAVGAATPGTANSTGSEDATVPDGLEVPAGTGVGISVQGFAAATPTAVGYIMAGLSGYEY